METNFFQSLKQARPKLNFTQKSSTVCQRTRSTFMVISTHTRVDCLTCSLSGAQIVLTASLKKKSKLSLEASTSCCFITKSDSMPASIMRQLLCQKVACFGCPSVQISRLQAFLNCRHLSYFCKTVSSTWTNSLSCQMHPSSR